MKRLYSIISLASIVFAALFVISAFTPLANLLAGGLKANTSNEKAGLIAVLGGGVYANGSLGSQSNERLINALLLYKQGMAPKIFFAGSTISSVTDKFSHIALGSPKGATLSEAMIMADISRALGVPDGAISVDASSASTYEDLLAIKAFMSNMKISACLIVTSPLHMHRAARAAEKLGLSCKMANVPDNTPERTGAIDRLALLREVFWEYAGLTLYRLYGYI